MSHLMPRLPVPSLVVPTLDGTPFDLAAAKPGRFSLVVFYRGLHCPICKTYVSELDRLEKDFADRGVAPIAISGDSEERARRTKADWNLGSVPIGHSLPLDTAREWGLYVSTSRGMTSIGVEAPARFSEPGVFLVRPDRTLYWASVQTMPFARPHFKEMLGAIDFIVAKDYPARGEA
jgi:peroxiredoxin